MASVYQRNNTQTQGRSTLKKKKRLKIAAKQLAEQEKRKTEDRSC